MRKRTGIASAAACSAFCASLSAGAAAQERAAPGAWSFQVTPYLWAAGLEGRVRPDARLPRLHVERSFGEVLEDLDAGLFVNALARRDRLVVMGDLSYVATSRRGAFEGTPFAGRGEVTQLTLGLAAGWRVVDQAGLSLDLLGGLRAWRLDAEAAVTAGGAPFAAASTDMSWVDPLVAVRLRADLAPRLSALVMGDVGGFGLGSRGTFQATAVLNWQVTERAYASFGYRYLTVDRRDGGRVADIALGGPVLGLTWRF